MYSPKETESSQQYSADLIWIHYQGAVKKIRSVAIKNAAEVTGWTHHSEQEFHVWANIDSTPHAVVGRQDAPTDAEGLNKLIAHYQATYSDLRAIWVEVVYHSALTKEALSLYCNFDFCMEMETYESCSGAASLSFWHNSVQ